MPVGAGGPAGRRDAVPMPAASGPEAERARGASCWTGPYPGSSGPCGAAFGGGREEPDQRLGAGTDPWREAPGLEVPVPGMGEGPDRGGGDRDAHPVSGSGPEPGPHRHRGPRPGVREASGDRTEARCELLLCHPLPFLGTGPERGRNEHTHGRVREYFPKGTDCRQVTPTLRALRGATGAASLDLQVPNSPLLGPMASVRVAAGRQDGCHPGPKRSARSANFWAAAAIPPSGYALIPGSRRLLHFGVEAGVQNNLCIVHKTSICDLL